MPARELADLAARLPVVALARKVAVSTPCAATTRSGAVLGVDHLIGLGHRADRLSRRWPGAGRGRTASGYRGPLRGRAARELPAAV